MKSLKVKLLRPEARAPKRAFRSAGFDLWPCNTGEIRPGERVVVPLGFSTEFEEGYVGVVDDRGSVGNAGVTHFAGVIDADYRGEWMLIMHNTGGDVYRYSPEKALAQVLFLRAEAPEVVVLEEGEELERSDRGSGRMGSSGH